MTNNDIKQIEVWYHTKYCDLIKEETKIRSMYDKAAAENNEDVMSILGDMIQEIGLAKEEIKAYGEYPDPVEDDPLLEDDGFEEYLAEAAQDYFESRIY